MELNQQDVLAATTRLAAELAGLEACDPALGPADRHRYVRAVLEDGIDELARADDARFDHVADCLLLAGQNMQDARLAALDGRVGTLEHPEPPTLPHLATDTAIMLGVELAIVLGAEVGVPALIALAAARVRSRTTRQLTAVPAEPLATLAATAADRREVVAGLRSVTAGTPGGATEFAEENARQQLADADQRLRIGLVAAMTGAESVEAVTETLDRLAAPTSPELTELLGGVAARTTVQRVAENGAVNVTARLHAAGAPPAPAARSPFLSSTYAGAVLAEIRRDQEEAAREWRRLRFAVRAVPDRHLTLSPLVHELCLRIQLFTPHPFVETGLATRREALVLGFETLLWLGWLRHAGALGAEPVAAFDVDRTWGPSPEAGMVFGTRHAESVTRDVAPGGSLVYRTSGTDYPGIARLADEGLATFLYFRYAGPWFTAHPRTAPAPLEFTPARYEQVAAMPGSTPLGFDNLDRSDRLAEMKLLVITFFRLLDAAPGGRLGGSAAQPSRDVLAALVEGREPLAAHLASLPTLQPPPPGPQAPPPVVVPGPDLTDPRAVAETAVLLLGQLVTELELAVVGQLGPVLTDDSAEAQAGRVAAADLAESIEALTTAVGQQRELVDRLAAGHPDLLARARAYDPRIARLQAARPVLGWQLDEPFLPAN